MGQIICKDLAIGYDGSIVKENLNFKVNTGDYISILGNNGEGKSLLIKTILGLIPKIDGEIVKSSNLKNNEIGYLPQHAEIQKDFPASVWEVVLSGFQNKCGWRPFYNKKEKAEALENLESLGITNLKNKSFRELSGGQKQRVLLARALSATTKIILLDEPTTGLDVETIKEFYKIMQNLNKKGLTIIAVSHDRKTSLEISSHILELGENIFFGSREEYLRTRGDNNA